MAKQFVGEEEELFFAICIVSEFDLFWLYFMSYFVKLNTGEFNQLKRTKHLKGFLVYCDANLTIFIRGVTLNTELDTVCLFVRHGQMTHF